MANLIKYYTILQFPNFNSVSVTYMAYFVLSLLWFEAAPSSGEFQEVEGESEERRKARLERHQRSQERVVCVIASLHLSP